MILYKALWEQWLTLALLGGGALAFAWALFYLAPLRSRGHPIEEPSWKKTFKAIPLIVILTYILAIAYTAIHTIWIMGQSAI